VLVGAGQTGDGSTAPLIQLGKTDPACGIVEATPLADGLSNLAEFGRSIRPDFIGQLESLASTPDATPTKAAWTGGGKTATHRHQVPLRDRSGSRSGRPLVMWTSSPAHSTRGDCSSPV